MGKRFFEGEQIVLEFNETKKGMVVDKDNCSFYVDQEFDDFWVAPKKPYLCRIKKSIPSKRKNSQVLFVLPLRRIY